METGYQTRTGPCLPIPSTVTLSESLSRNLGATQTSGRHEEVPIDNLSIFSYRCDGTLTYSKSKHYHNSTAQVCFACRGVGVWIFRMSGCDAGRGSRHGILKLSRDNETQGDGTQRSSGCQECRSRRIHLYKRWLVREGKQHIGMG